MEDLDYKDLFRDAIHTIAYIARAAGFDPNDPTVEPPAIVARVENQRADLERLTAERAALLGSAEGVDLEEVLRLDREGTAGPWHMRAAETENGYGTHAVSPDSAIEDGLSPTDLTLVGRTITMGVSGHDAALIATYRTAAPALARALMAERAYVREVEASEKRLMAEAEELRLTLAAEQGKP